MAALLQQVLEGPELSKLPKTAQNKLERALSEQQYEIDALKAQQEQFRVDSGKGLFSIWTSRKYLCCAHQSVLARRPT